MPTTRLRLHRWENEGAREVAIDYRAALTDALLLYDVPTRAVIAEFERLASDPNYEEEED